MSRRLRAFVALNLSVPVVRRIADEVERRKKALTGGHIAWVPAANYHITLKFLGSVPEESLEAVQGALKKIEKTPFEVRVRGTGGFPAGDQPSVLWVGLESGGADALEKLQAQVESAMSEVGFAPENVQRKFHPHVTVGRVKQRGADFASWASDSELGSCTVNEIVVYESKTERAGAEYIARARIPFSKSS